MKTEARFPKLLDGVIDQILNAGLAKAENNYKNALGQVMDSFREKLHVKMSSSGGYLDEGRGICWFDDKAADAGGAR